MRSLITAFVVVILTSVGCKKEKEPEHPPASSSAFLHDDVDGAFAQALASDKLVFVDTWAPWCHTCRSMQRDVLSSPELAQFSDRYVFLAVDTDREKNAWFVERFLVKVWPTFFVVDPKSEKPLAVRPGSMTLDETKKFLAQAHAARSAEASSNDPLLRALLAGHAALAKNDPTTATKHYAIAAAAEHPRRAEAILAGLRAFSLTDDAAGCLAFGLPHLDTLKLGGQPGDACSYLLSCADKLEDEAKKKETRQTLQKKLQDLAASPPADISVDDLADVMANLADVTEELGDKPAALTIHEKRLALLVADAQKQTTAEAQQVHDYARMGSLLALGRGDEAVALFTQRTKEKPQDYEPWARLASTLNKLKRFDEAKPAAEKAVALSYGPRRLGYLQLLADIETGRNDKAAAEAALRTLIADGEKLAPAQQNPKAVAKAKQQLDAASPTSNAAVVP